MKLGRSFSLLGYAWASLLRRKGRSFAIYGGLTSVTALLLGVFFVTTALVMEAQMARELSPDIVVQKLRGGRPALIGEAHAGPIRKLPAVKSVTPRVWGYLFLPALEGNIAVMGAELSRPPKSLGLSLSAPRQKAPAGEHGALLGSQLALQLGLAPGDRLRLPAAGDEPVELFVEATFSSDISLLSADLLVVPKPVAAEIFGLAKGEASDLAVRLTNPNESALVAEKIQGLVRGSRVLEKRVLRRVHSLAYGRRSGFVLGACVPAILALMILAWDRISGLGPAEKQELAIIKACGWSSQDVLQAKLFEAMLIALGAGATAVILAYGWVFGLGAPGLRESLAGWSVIFPRADLYPGFDWSSVFGVEAAILGPFLGLSIVPAWRAAMADPFDLLRGS